LRLRASSTAAARVSATMAWKAYYKKDLTPPAGGAFYKHIAGLHDLNMLDDILNAVNEAREAEVQRLDKIERKREAARSSAANGHVLPSEPLKRTDNTKEFVYPTFKSESGLIWYPAKSMDRIGSEGAGEAAGVHRRGTSLMAKPERDKVRDGWVGGPKWMYSREKKHVGSEKWIVDKNEMLLEKGKKWFPMYAEMQTQVEQAFQSWQLALISDPKSKGRLWEGVDEPRPSLPTINKFLVGSTEEKDPHKDDRWQYEIDFREMTQKNIKLNMVRKIRRFGMDFEGHDDSVEVGTVFDPETVGRDDVKTAQRS